MAARRRLSWDAPLAAIALVAALAVPAQAAQYLLYSGTYTSGSSKDIYTFRFDSDTGALLPIGLVAETRQPAHIWITPNGKYLYAPGGLFFDPQLAK